MQKSEIDKMAEMEKTYWWHIGRNFIIKTFLKDTGCSEQSKIANIGAGTGGLVKTLEKFGQVSNFDTSSQAVKICKENGYHNTVLFDGLVLPVLDEEFDLAVAFDVLEHIKEDDKALMDWFRVVRKDGYILITVPAYQWLWSGHDEALGHYRRYTASQLHRKLNLVGFEVVKRSYAITLSFPLIFGYRLLNSLFFPKKDTPKTSYVILPDWFNNFLIWLLKVEAFLLESLNFPFGSSIIILARKSSGQNTG